MQSVSVLQGTPLLIASGSRPQWIRKAATSPHGNYRGATSAVPWQLLCSWITSLRLRSQQSESGATIELHPDNWGGRRRYSPATVAFPGKSVSVHEN